jgi:Family of unknown function (DUF6279)
MRPLHVAAILVLAWAASGCGVKFAYNNLDRFAHWTMDDYMSLDGAQQAYFDAQLDVVLYWHRTTQVPIYAQALRDADRSLADGASVEEMFVLRDDVEQWWRAIQEAALPMMSELLYSATDAQLEQFAAQYDEDTLKYIKPYVKLSPEKRRARWAKEYREGMEYFTGRLSKQQRQLIAAYQQRYVPDEAAWQAYRDRYGDALIAMVRQREPFAKFALQLRAMALSRENWYGEAYRDALAANSALYADVSVALINSLDAEQRARLSERLAGIAQDFVELSQELPDNVPTAGCLVTCS